MTSSPCDAGVRDFRLAVASRALSSLPVALGEGAAAKLAASTSTRVVRERSCALELMLATLVLGLIVGWVVAGPRHGRW